MERLNDLWAWVLGLSDGNKIALAGVALVVLGGVWKLVTMVWRLFRRPKRDLPEDIVRGFLKNSEADRKRLERIEAENAQLQQTNLEKDDKIRELLDAVEGLREIERQSDKEGRVTSKQAFEAEEALKVGDAEKAKQLFRTIAETHLADAQHNNEEAAQAYRRLGALAFLTDTDEALAAYQKAVDLAPGDPDGWNQLGRLLARTGDLDASTSAYENVLEFGIAANDKGIVAVAYGNLGNLRSTQGDLSGAEDYYRKALALNEELGRKEGTAIQCGNLGILRSMQGDLFGAEEYYRKSLAIEKELGRKEGMASDYGNLGILRKTQGDFSGAEEYWRKSLTLFEEIGAQPMIEKVQKSLDELYE